MRTNPYIEADMKREGLARLQPLSVQWRGWRGRGKVAGELTSHDSIKGNIVRN